MTVTYELVQRDFYDAFIAHRNRSAVTKWFLRFMLCVLVVLIASTALSMALLPDFHLDIKGNVFSLIVFVAVWSFIIWGAPWLSARNQFRKQPSAQGPRSVSLDAAGIHWKWNGGSADIEWKNFVRFQETRSQFLLYSSPVCFNVVPKRALDPNQMDIFRTLVAENLPPGSSSAASKMKLSPRGWAFLLVVLVALVLLVMAIRNIH